MRSTRSLTALLGLASVAAGKQAADPWRDPAYQQRQYDLAVSASNKIGGDYLKLRCASLYPAITTTQRVTTTSTSATVLVTFRTSLTTVRSTKVIQSTTRPLETVHSTATSLTTSAETATETEVVTSTVPADGGMRREKRAKQATGPALARQQIDSIVKRLGQYNATFLQAQCGTLNNVVVLQTRTQVVPTTIVNTRTRSATKSLISSSTNVVTLPSTTVQVDSTVFSTVLEPTTTTTTTTTTVTAAPTQISSAAAYVTCPDPLESSDYLLSVDTTKGTTKCVYKRTGRADYYGIWRNSDGMLVDSSLPVAQFLNVSDATGTACADATSCPSFPGHTLDAYRSGQILTRTGDQLSSDNWSLKLSCVYDSGVTSCNYDEDSDLLTDGDNECPDKLDAGAPTGACAFGDKPPVTPPPTPSAGGAYVCPISTDSRYVLGFGASSLNTLICQYANNNDKHNFAYSCRYSQTDGSAMQIEDRCLPAATDSTITAGTYKYKLPSLCPAEMDGQQLDTADYFGNELQQTSLDLSYDRASGSIVEGSRSYLGCRYTSGAMCYFDATSGYKIATAFIYSSDMGCPESVSGGAGPTPDPTPEPKKFGAYTCPLPTSSAVSLAFTAYSANTVHCEYANNDEYHHLAYKCDYSQSDGTKLSGDSRCTAAVYDDTIASGTYKYKLPNSCPSTLSASSIDPTDNPQDYIQQTSLDMSWSTSNTVQSQYSYLACRYSSGSMCYFDINSGSKLDKAFVYSSDSSCPDRTPDSPADEPGFGSYTCPMPTSSSVVMGFAAYSAKTTHCEYADNDAYHHLAYTCDYEQRTGNPLTGDSRCLPAVKDDRIKAGTYIYKLPTACPATLSGSALNTADNISDRTQQTSLDLSYSTSNTVQTQYSFLACMYASGAGCYYNIENGAKLDRAFVYNSDPACPADV